MKRSLLLITILLSATALHAGHTPRIIHHDIGTVTFEVDQVPTAKSHLSLESGLELAKRLHDPEDVFLDNTPPIHFCSFAEDPVISLGGEDVLYNMLLNAWCQHRPVVLTPDAIWMVITQGLSYYVNQDPEAARKYFVDHKGKKELTVQTNNLYSKNADWTCLVEDFISEIGKNSINGYPNALLADFTTTGVNERIASDITLMDVVKPYYDYTAVYVACGVPSVTIKGTPDDWQKVLTKTRTLESYGLGWWVKDLEPILAEFISAAQGNPNLSFWKDMVKKTRPQKVRGPGCGGNGVKMTTKFDGWFLKLFPYDSEGKTHGDVTIVQAMLRETVCVPFKYKVVDSFGAVISEEGMELVAGIVGVTEDCETYALTPKIGWFVRGATSKDRIVIDQSKSDFFLAPNEQQRENNALSYRDLSINSSVKYWADGPLTLDDFSSRKSEWPRVLEFEYGISWTLKSWKFDNTVISSPFLQSYITPYSSWIHPDFRNAGALLFMQTAFDYVEICRRRAQIDLRNASLFSNNNIVKYHMDVADSFIAKLKDDTQQGRDTAAVQFYADLVSAELARTKDPQFTDLMISPDGFGIGGHFGLGSEFYTGDICEYVTPIVGIDFGFDFFYNRVNLFLNGVIGCGGRFKKDVPINGYKWDAGERIGGGELDLSLGYAVLDSQWWKITPFVGIGVGFIDYPKSPAYTNKDSDEISGFRYQAGVCADYKFRRDINMYTRLDGLNEFTVRAKLFLAHTAFPGSLQTWSINFGISANALSWIMIR